MVGTYGKKDYTTEILEEDKMIENELRPAKLDDYIGKVKSRVIFGHT